MAIIQSIWALPLLAVAIVTNLLPTDTVTVTDDSPIDWQHDLVIPLLVLAAVVAVAALLGLSIQLAMLDVLVQRATGQQISVKAALLAGLKRVPAMIGWAFLEGLLILAGFVLCILPGIYVAVALAVLPAVVLLERGNGIGRAFQLFHADFGAAIARIGTIVGLSLAFSVVENAFAGALGGGGIFNANDPSTPVAVIVGVLSVIISIASSIILSPLLLTAYADMRARREPFSTAYLVPQSQPTPES